MSSNLCFSASLTLSFNNQREIISDRVKNKATSSLKVKKVKKMLVLDNFKYYFSSNLWRCYKFL